MSSIIVYHHPIFEPVLGPFVDVVINHREDGLTIDEEATYSNIKDMFKASRLDFLDTWNYDFYNSFEKPIVALFTNHPSVEDLGGNKEFYSQLARILYKGGV